MQKMTQEDITSFYKLLLQFSNFTLDDTKGVILTHDGKECLAMDPRTNTEKPIRITRPGMVDDPAYTDLNPLLVLEGVQPALAWFWQTRLAGLSAIVKEIILSCLTTGVEAKDEDYDRLSLITGISSKFDKQMITDVGKINSADIFRIFYDKSRKTAEAQTELFTEGIQKKHKFRKKTWEVVQELFLRIFGITKADDLEKYRYKATILSIPDIDAKMHVVLMVMKQIGGYVEKFMTLNIPIDELEKHVANLETYAKVSAWMTATVAKKMSASATPGWGAIPVTNKSTSTVIRAANTEAHPQQIPVAPATSIMPPAVETPALPKAIPVPGFPYSQQSGGLVGATAVPVSFGAVMPPATEPIDAEGIRARNVIRVG